MWSTDTVERFDVKRNAELVFNALNHCNRALAAIRSKPLAFATQRVSRSDAVAKQVNARTGVCLNSEFDSTNDCHPLPFDEWPAEVSVKPAVIGQRNSIQSSVSGGRWDGCRR